MSPCIGLAIGVPFVTRGPTYGDIIPEGALYDSEMDVLTDSDGDILIEGT